MGIRYAKLTCCYHEIIASCIKQSEVGVGGCGRREVGDKSHTTTTCLLAQEETPSSGSHAELAKARVREVAPGLPGAPGSSPPHLVVARRGDRIELRHGAGQRRAEMAQRGLPVVARAGVGDCSREGRPPPLLLRRCSVNERCSPVRSAQSMDNSGSAEVAVQAACPLWSVGKWDTNLSVPQSRE